MFGWRRVKIKYCEILDVAIRILGPRKRKRENRVDDFGRNEEEFNEEWRIGGGYYEVLVCINRRKRVWRSELLSKWRVFMVEWTFDVQPTTDLEHDIGQLDLDHIVNEVDTLLKGLFGKLTIRFINWTINRVGQGTTQNGVIW